MTKEPRNNRRNKSSQPSFSCGFVEDLFIIYGCGRSKPYFLQLNKTNPVFLKPNYIMYYLFKYEHQSEYLFSYWFAEERLQKSNRFHLSYKSGYSDTGTALNLNHVFSFTRSWENLVEIDIDNSYNLLFCE